MDNVQILNAIRAAASSEYQSRIPSATQTNLSDILQSVMTYKSSKDEFTGILLNKIVKQIIMNKLYTNPYKFFKKEPLPVGKTIEAIFVDIIQAKSFDEHFGDGSSEASSLLATEKPDLKVEYYEENYKHKYKVSLSDERLKSAFLDTNGLQSMTTAIIQSALTSAEYDEFLLVKNLLSSVKIKDITIPGYKALADENKQSKALTKKIKTMVAKFKFMSKDYNTQGVNTHSNGSELVIFVTPETSSMVDVELLASAFNMQKADIDGRLVLIDEFTRKAVQQDVDDGIASEVGDLIPDTDTLALVCDIDLIQLRDTVNTSESFRNPDTLTTNMFFHRWGSACATGFVNAVKIKQA